MCDICGHIVTTLESLTKHIQCNHDPRQEVCQVCDLVFKTSELLETPPYPPT